jgi:hypothetical protein
MAGRNPLNSMKFVKVKDHSAASTAAVTSDIVDTAGYQGVVFITSFGTADATNTMKVQQNTANQTTGMEDLAGSSISSGTTDEDVIVNIHQPRERYVQAVIARGASSTLESIWAVLYGGDTSVTGNTVAGTQTAEQLVSPAEGTA